MRSRLTQRRASWSGSRTTATPIRAMTATSCATSFCLVWKRAFPPIARRFRAPAATWPIILSLPTIWQRSTRMRSTTAWSRLRACAVLSDARALNLLRRMFASRGLPMPNRTRLEETVRQCRAAGADSEVHVSFGSHGLRCFRGQVGIVEEIRRDACRLVHAMGRPQGVVVARRAGDAARAFSARRRHCRAILCTTRRDRARPQRRRAHAPGGTIARAVR